MQRRNLMDRAKLKDLDPETKKLTYAVQKSTINSMIAGQAFTKYSCKFCGEEGSWPNTAVPKICIGCAVKMAKNMIKRGGVNV